MAGLKKAPKKKEGSKTSPALIFFMVFFFLLAVGLGVWGYYGYDGQKTLVDAKKKAETETKAARQAEQYALFVARAAREAIGHKLDSDEVPLQAQAWKDFAEGKFQAEKSSAEIKKAMDELKRPEMLGWNESAQRFKIDLKKRLYDIDLEKSLAFGGVVDAKKETAAAQQKIDELVALSEKDRANVYEEIRKTNIGMLTNASKKSEEYEQVRKTLEETQKERDQISEELESKKAEIIRLQKTFNEKLAKALGTKEDFVQLDRVLDFHALILDISPGKALWDNPLGKISRINLQDRTVNINLGDKNGVSQGLTFMVFGAGPDGRAAKELKGTIEVIRTLGEITSLARITSLYDSDGKEIDLGDPARNRTQNIASNPFKEGDLLFNPIWGSHVAVMGNVNLNGTLPTNPAEQLRTLNDFLYYLRKQGIVVDAYLDPTDGKLKGSLTHKTRYLIRGGELTDAAPSLLRVKEAEPAELSERLKQVRETTNALKKEAIEQGMLLISAENFAIVTGYRPPRGANGSSLSPIGFQPRTPIAGSTDSSQLVAPNPFSKDKTAP